MRLQSKSGPHVEMYTLRNITEIKMYSCPVQSNSILGVYWNDVIWMIYGEKCNGKVLLPPCKLCCEDISHIYMPLPISQKATSVYAYNF